MESIGRTGEVKKTVTAVFCDLADSTALAERIDQETLRIVLNAYYTRMQKVLTGNGGSVQKFIGDAVVAFFGIPRTSPDDALRAVRAATEMRDELADLNENELTHLGVHLRVRIGINTGEVIAGGSGKPGSFVSGDAINVAARLEQSAPVDGILIGAATYELTASNIVARPVTPIVAKGKSKPVPAFALVELLTGISQSAIGSGSPLIGRTSELEILESALERHRLGQPAVVLLTGPPGIGKSRIVSELLRRIETTSVRLRCSPPEGGSALGGVTGLQTRPRLPETIVVDDLQWATDLELEVVVDTLDEKRDPASFGILVGRPEAAVRPHLASLDKRLLRIHVAPLSDNEVEQIVSSIATFPDPALTAQIVSAAEGNALHARELARFASLGGGKLPPDRVPMTVTALLAARIEEIPRHERFLLECAAVIGQASRRADLCRLAEACGEPEPESALEPLLARQLLRSSMSGGEGNRELLIFESTVVREVVYGLTLNSARAMIHERYARQLMEGGSSAARPEDIARHLLGAAESLPEHEAGKKRRAELAREAGLQLGSIGSGTVLQSAVSSDLTRRIALMMGSDHKETAAGEPKVPVQRTAPALARIELVDGLGKIVMVEMPPSASPLRIGRRSTCDVPVPWDSEVSRNHAELVLKESEWWVRDLDSRNGVTLNGAFIESESKLGDGDRIGIGLTEILFRAAAARNIGPRDDV